jgi:hypothetical protein
MINDLLWACNPLEERTLMDKIYETVKPSYVFEEDGVIVSMKLITDIEEFNKYGV